MATVVHILNQFFAGIGGEDKANLPAFPESFLPTFSKELAAKAAAAQKARDKSDAAKGEKPGRASKAKKSPKKEAPQPEFIGPRGQQEPK